ncbi:MAG: hypothetical protein OYL97_01650 [Candidatus Poribacteria bacterium]|nr:hypothetical protein [Candidatus Poribacteria bacterium]
MAVNKRSDRGIVSTEESRESEFPLTGDKKQIDSRESEFPPTGKKKQVDRCL